MTTLSSTTELITELRAGRPVIMVDDEDRENEGDLIIPAEKITPEWMAFIIRYTGGVVCVAMPDEHADHLQLPPMVKQNQSLRQTAFTVSIEAKHGVDTGISAHDRSVTIAATVKPGVDADDLVRPGHVFPLRAREGGVLRRRGHTEATVDLCRLAGFQPVGALSELMHDDGSMMRLPAISAFAARHDLKVGSIADLVAYRTRHDGFLRRVASAELPTQWAGFKLHGFADELTGQEHVALTLGAIEPEGASLVRIHSECLFGASLGSLHCECNALRDAAVAKMASEGSGILVYLRSSPQEGWFDRLKAHREDARRPDAEPDYSAAAQILRHLGVQRLRLLTNDPCEGTALAAYGTSVAECLPL